MVDFSHFINTLIQEIPCECIENWNVRIFCIECQVWGMILRKIKEVGRKFLHQRAMSALKGLAKAGGSVNRVISRNGGWGCYAGSRASKCIHKTGTGVGKPLLQQQKQLSGRLYVSRLPAELGKEGLERETGEPFGSHRRGFYECQVHFPLSMQTLFSCLFSPVMEYSYPVSQSQFQFLSEGSWQGQLKASCHPGFHQPCWGQGHPP